MSSPSIWGYTAGLCEEVHLVPAHGTALPGVQIVGIIGNLRLFTVLPLLNDLVLDVIGGALLGAAAQKTDCVA